MLQITTYPLELNLSKLLLKMLCHSAVKMRTWASTKNKIYLILIGFGHPRTFCCLRLVQNLGKYVKNLCRTFKIMSFHKSQLLYDFFCLHNTSNWSKARKKKWKMMNRKTERAKNGKLELKHHEKEIHANC